jgi:hypothetical protein
MRSTIESRSQRYNKKARLQHLFSSFSWAILGLKFGYSDYLVILQITIAATAATAIFPSEYHKIFFEKTFLDKILYIKTVLLYFTILYDVY